MLNQRSMPHLLSVVIAIVSLLAVSASATDCDPVVPDGLIAYYSFDDQTADDCVGSYHGTLTGSATFGNMTDPGCGWVLDLTSGAGAVEIGDHSAFHFADDSMSVSCWVQIAGNDNVTRIFVMLGKSTTYSNQSVIHLSKVRSGEDGGHIQFSVSRHGHNSTAIFSDLDGDELPKNTWMHVVGVIDKVTDEVRLYIDGVRQSHHYYYDDSPVIAYDLNGGSDPFEVNLGRYVGDIGYHTGVLDDTRIYDRPLSDADVLEIYASELDRHQGPCAVAVESRSWSSVKGLFR